MLRTELRVRAWGMNETSYGGFNNEWIYRIGKIKFNLRDVVLKYQYLSDFYMLYLLLTCSFNSGVFIKQTSC